LTSSTTGWVVVAGVDGILTGEVLLLAVGQEATFGRGSGSTFPLTRAAGYRRLSEDPAELRRACQGVSRCHLRIAVPERGVAEIESLSRGGTLLDGRRLDGVVPLRDLADRSHEIRFGKHERLEIRWHDADGTA
jgi:hypothetical protein